jgi:hypothetical protein
MVWSMLYIESMLSISLKQDEQALVREILPLV